MAVTTCTVSGTLRDSTGTAIQGATVEAYNSKEYFYGDGSLIGIGKVSTTTDSNGAWSLTLAENASTSTNTLIAILYTDGGSGQVRREYYITVPNSGTANFSDLADGQ